MGEIIGREWRWIRVDLSTWAREAAAAEVAESFAKQREAEADFDSFAKWAEPRARRSLDPQYTPPEEIESAPIVSHEEALALLDEVEFRRKQKGARVAVIKAQRAAALRAEVAGYRYQRLECDVVTDDDRPEVRYVSVESGAEVDRRAMTPGERQTHLPGLGRETAAGAEEPAPKKKTRAKKKPGTPPAAI